MKIDQTKLVLTISAAAEALTRLEKAISDFDHRAIGRELYNLRRELSELKRLVMGSE